MLHDLIIVQHAAPEPASGGTHFLFLLASSVASLPDSPATHQSSDDEA
jgi:hypothetical protein